MAIWRMRIAFSIPKATNTHSGCLTFVVFSLQQWLNESASVLRYTYIACLTVFACVIVTKDEMSLTHLLFYCYSENSDFALTADVLCL